VRLLLIEPHHHNHHYPSFPRYQAIQRVVSPIPATRKDTI